MERNVKTNHSNFIFRQRKEIMIVLLHAIGAVFLLLASASAQKYDINIRDGSKICTQWISPVNGQFSVSYTHQKECTSNLFWEQANGQARICCQGMALTTSSTNFPKECGKQKYRPLGTRIIGGNEANVNSWVISFSFVHITSKFFCLALANSITRSR